MWCWRHARAMEADGLQTIGQEFRHDVLPVRQAVGQSAGSLPPIRRTHHKGGHLQVLLDCNPLREQGMRHWLLHEQGQKRPCRGAAAFLLCGCRCLLLLLLLLLARPLGEAVEAGSGALHGL